MDNVLIYSFYTNDDYYRGKAEELKENLERLCIQHQIDMMEIPEGLDWSDICRKKIEMIANACRQHPDRKVFWIDVDCNIKELPSYIGNFSSDIIGFARGFSSPLRLGYHLRTRFWEPCFVGINATEKARNFIFRAEELEKEFDGKATDDYFFEEAWRECCDQLSYQVIPSFERNKNGSVNGFFSFGASGNVNDFKGKVVQHEKIIEKSDTAENKPIKESPTKENLKKVFNRLSSLINKKKDVVKVYEKITKKSYKLWCVSNAIKGDMEKLRTLQSRPIAFSPKDKAMIDKQCNAIVEYQTMYPGTKALPLCWWFNPEPGNFGDWLSPYIVSKIMKRNVKLVSPAQVNNQKSKYLVSTGSIAKFANEHAVVLGSGISREETELSAEAKYLSVRGPLTADVLSKQGGQAPDVFGDPAIVMPKLLPMPKVEKNGRVALVRHFSHLSLDIELAEGMDELSILSSSPSDIEKFIAELNNYSAVVTSAMHCYIICQSYGIPAALVVWDEVKENVAGDGMKYHDYALGAGVTPLSPLAIDKDLRSIDLNAILNTDVIAKDKIDMMYDFIFESLTKEF
ncbi:polysaccharide pyruvyl transferase family protein [Ferrimonas balearica]|uniref:polysaccharide pyruvyl transferase family protein n=1 Tax=Ferrimonas balearica TaxID=44012 RepID=UPI001C595CA0|nr:polysaccharide pyruvyl transferase family protein [Ferrimonas balearica]MBW3138189.1 polysaccharide pyruvyl transferase family protein [Ferrimonas balearica]